MKVAAITITYNRLDLTKKMVESFYSKTKVDYHLFIDNGSTDGTPEWLAERFDHILLSRNYGIAKAFAAAYDNLPDFDFVLKLDNDVETVTDELIEKMVFFLKRNPKYVVTPVDLNITPQFEPHVFEKLEVDNHRLSLTTHTGGAYQLAPREACDRLVRGNMKTFLKGDIYIGAFYRTIGYRPAYLLDYEMRHIGFNKSTPGDEYLF